MIIKKNITALAILFVCVAGLPDAALALPANQNQLLLKTGTAKRTGETAFSYLVSWRKGDANLHRANGLTFINGTDSKKPNTAIGTARKLTKSINAGIDYEAPQDRGASASNTKDKAEVLVSNREGFDLTQITVRDYSNQELHYNIPGKNFKAASVDVAIDLVYSAAVEYIDGFASNGKKKTAGGWVTINIDNKAPIKIKTDGKSNRQLEKEIAKALGSGAKFSSTPIYANFVALKSRNYKAFDGGEVQLPNLSANAITIDINDSGLGILTKFKFPDTNKPTDVAGKMPYLVGLLLAGILAYFLFTWKRKAM
jgi:hypothetical protein